MLGFGSVFKPLRVMSAVWFCVVVYLMMPNPVLVVSVDRCVSVMCRATPHRCCWFERSGRVAVGAALCCVVVVSVYYIC